MGKNKMSSGLSRFRKSVLYTEQIIWLYSTLIIKQISDKTILTLLENITENKKIINLSKTKTT